MALPALTLKTAHGLVRRARTEIAALIALAAAGLGLLAFAKIVDETMEGETHTFDEAVLLALRAPNDTSNPIGPPWFEHAVGDITALGGFTVLTLLVAFVALYLAFTAKRASALLVVGASASGALLSELLKFGFARPRPELAAHLTSAYNSSFPSGHAMISAIVYLTLGALLTRIDERRGVKALILSYAIILTVLIGASRVYLGVHWPTDVLAGWALGAAWAALWWLVMVWLQDARAIEPPTPAQEDAATAQQ